MNQNFTDLINGLSDTTKNISISALTAAGATNLQGAVTLGASTSNALTINASLSSSLAIGTTFSYDIGGSTIGLRSLYLGDAGSQARCTRVIGATISAGWTLTLPTSGGTSGYVLSTDGSGVGSWVASDKLNVVTKTGTYTVNSTPTDQLLLGNTNAFTFTLPAANAISGKQYKFKKIGSDTNAVTIARAGSDTIEGATSIALSTQYESVTLVSDGSATWYILDHEYPTAWNSSLTFTFSAGFGTLADVNIYSRRVGDSLEIRGYAQAGTIAGSTASIALPSGYAISSSKNGSGTLKNALPGLFKRNAGSGNDVLTAIANSFLFFYDGSDTANIYLSSVTTLAKSNANSVLGSSEYFFFWVSVPISGWF